MGARGCGLGHVPEVLQKKLAPMQSSGFSSVHGKSIISGLHYIHCKHLSI